MTGPVPRRGSSAQPTGVAPGGKARRDVDVRDALATVEDPGRVSVGSGRLVTQNAGGEVARLHLIYAVTRDRRIRNQLVAHYDPFALSLARRFSTRRESVEDLVQVARVGLIHAVDRFDPARERPFQAFARSTILGELKRHLRDHTWRMRVPRGLQEDYLQVVRTADDLTQELGRSPSICEVAARAGLSEDRTFEAINVGRSDWLSPPDPDDGQAVEVAVDEKGFSQVEDHLVLADALRCLSPREQHIFRLRFKDERSQAQIAIQVGTNQMAISRILTHNLNRMHAYLHSSSETLR